MINLPLPWLVLSLLVTAAAVAADSGGGTTTYRWVDAQGVVHYSDTPQPGAQRLEIQPAQTFPDQGMHASSQSVSATPAAASGYRACMISQPTAQQAFYTPDSVVVAVQLSPRLRAGDQLSVTMDGKPLAPVDDDGVRFQVSSPYRGEHTVRAEVRSAEGHILCQAMPVTFYVQRPGLLSPQAPSQGHATSPIPGR